LNLDHRVATLRVGPAMTEWNKTGRGQIRFNQEELSPAVSRVIVAALVSPQFSGDLSVTTWPAPATTAIGIFHA
jgi:hypothetical protein